MVTEYAACRDWVRGLLQAQMRPQLASVWPGAVKLVGTGGTATLLGRLERRLDHFDREAIESVRLSRAQVEAWSARLWRLPLAERQGIAGLPRMRADVILMGMVIYEAVGCDGCNEGYKGRVGIYQVMPMLEDIQKIVLKGGNALQIAEVAKAAGINDLRASAMLKVKNGFTSLAEIDRVTKD